MFRGLVYFGVRVLSGNKTKSNKWWPLKIFIITLLISAGVSVIAELFLSDMGIISAALVVLVLILFGIAADIVGVAFASCEQTPFIAMSSKKIKRAVRALKLLKNAEAVANVCNDVIGDVCGIVSGAAGAAIVVKIVLTMPNTPQLVISIAVSSLIAALTVAGKALGKGFAMRNNVKIVESIGAALAIFDRAPKKREKPCKK